MLIDKSNVTEASKCCLQKNIITAFIHNKTRNTVV